MNEPKQFNANCIAPILEINVDSKGAAEFEIDHDGTICISYTRQDDCAFSFWMKAEDREHLRNWLNRHAAKKRQYYCKVNACRASFASDPECICWHDEGTGPLSPEEQKDASNWRDVGSETLHWIPVGERLPDDPDKEVLVYAAGEFDGIGVDAYRFGPDGDDWENFGEDVTHWMPLPEAPK